VAVVEPIAIILLALMTLAMLPCLFAFVLFVDAFASVVQRQRRRISRAARHAATLETVDETVPIDPARPPLEKIAAEIHRLNFARRTSVEGSSRFTAATRAYDRRLGHACQALEIDEHLAELDGVDLELERLRVEGELLAAGFVLDTDYSHPA
jgi:hypothetical protein